MPKANRRDISDLHVMRVGLYIKVHPDIYRIGDKDIYLMQLINEVPIDPEIEPIGFTMIGGNAIYLWKNTTWSNVSMNSDLLQIKASKLAAKKVISQTEYSTLCCLLAGYKYYIPLTMNTSFRYTCYRLLYPIADPFI